MALVVSSQSNKIFKFFSSKLYKIRARSFQSLILRFSKPKCRALYHPQSLERTCANFLHTGGANCNTLIYRYVGRNKEVPVMWIIGSTVSAMVAYVDPLSSKWSQLPVCWKKKTESIWGVQVAELHKVGGATQLDGRDPACSFGSHSSVVPHHLTCLNSLDHNCICKYFLQLSSNNYWRL